MPDPGAPATALLDIPVVVIEGSLARSARILGAAALPLAHFFEPDGALA
ncbi:hypothetical protein [Paracoccus sp. S3-43]|nr:hypothetical protein [Paracoccus sp. S3-43]WEF22893.1 hypothetical protein PXD02_08505 [Paracoccus sp. S3-43]